MLRAVTFDYWDTLFLGTALPERIAFRQAAVRRMLEKFGCTVPEEQFVALYKASGDEADRWWREEHRGYSAAERIRWMLERLRIERPADCEHIARAVEAMDDALLALPPQLVPGAREAVEVIGRHYALGIVSDTGVASGRAQDRVLDQHDIRSAFAATIYSVDIGYAKPRPEPFHAVANALGLAPGEILHVGDNERTDVRGALAAGCRAIRLDAVRESGPSSAEFVARSLPEVVEYVLGLARTDV